MKKRNKKYKPKPIALPLTMRFFEKEEYILQLVPHQELAQMREGKGEERNWHTIACRVNLGATLAIMKFEQVKDEFKIALDALRSIKSRAEKIGKWVMSGDEYKALGEALCLTDDMQKESTRRELNTAMDVVFKEAAIYK